MLKIGKMKGILLFIGAVIGLGVGWYLLSPVFIDRVVNEGFPSEHPQSAEDPALRFEPAVATATMAAVMLGEDNVMDEPMPTQESDEMVILYQGEF